VGGATTRARRRRVQYAPRHAPVQRAPGALTSFLHHPRRIARRTARTHTGAVSRDLVVYRRDLPGGRIVMISIDERDPSAVVGHLLMERRTDPARRSGQPPVLAEVRGATRAEVLASLRTLAESESEVGRRLDAWLAERRTAPAASGVRVRMPDGTWWSVERRHEMTQLSLGEGLSGGAAPRDRALFLFFHGGDGALRRIPVREDFPEHPSEDELRELWARAVVLR